MYENPSSKAALSVSSSWTSRIHDNRHFGYSIKYRSRSWAHKCLEKPISEADKGHSSHYSNIDVRWECICQQLGHPIRYTDISTIWKRTPIQIEVLHSRDRKLGNRPVDKSCLPHPHQRTIGKIQQSICRVPLPTRCRASEILESVWTTSEICRQYAGIQTEVHDTIQPPDHTTENPASSIPNDMTELP